MKKRLLSTMLALCLVLTMLPLNALATDEPPTETVTGAESQKEENTTPENPTPVTPTQVITDGQTEDLKSDGANGLENPPENDSNYNDGQDEPMILSETEEPARTSITDPGLTASGTCGNNATWTLNTYTGVLTISGSGRMTKGQWSAYETIVKTIVIQDGITSIGEWAFHGFKNLTDITIPNSVTTIEKGAFTSCTSVTNITIPNSVVSIEQAAFSGCLSLSSIDIPDSVTNLGMQAFSECRNLTSVALPKGITTIERSVFENCENLVNVTIPNGVTTIRAGAFSYCGFESIDIPDSVTKIEGDAFTFCRHLKSIVIPNSVIEIENTSAGSGAFWECAGLISVILSENLTELQNSLFKSCSQLANVYIPKNVTNIGVAAFADCNNLSDIYYSGSEDEWNAIAIGLSNEPLEKATIHYNSKPEDVPIPRDFRVYRNGGYETFDVSLEECKSRTNSTQYNPQLAHMLIAMCNSVDNETDIRNTFRSFGFVEENTKTNYSMMNGIYLGYGIAKKQIANKTVMLIVARGSKDIQEWISNLADFKPNIKGQHSGFADAANGLYNQIISLLGTSDFSNVEFVITGFSRGAAVANILAARLIDEKNPIGNIHAYTFACPDTVATISSSTEKNYPCIFNIANVNDIVSWAPGGVVGSISTAWNKYGKSYWYSENWDDHQNLEMGIGAHNQVKYMDFLRSERSEKEYRSRGDAKFALNIADIRRKLKRITAFIGIYCPVDVEIRTANDELVGTVTNNIPNEIMSEKIRITVNGDQKEIYLLDDDKYIINLVGTDDGTMKYSVQNIDVNTWNATEEKAFTNVALANGKKMISYVNARNDENGGVDVPNVQLFILGANGQPEKEILPDGNGTEVYISRTVTFDANGGTVEPTAMTTETDGKLVNLPTATRRSYKFKGWYTAANGGTQITVNTIFTSDTTVYAQWSKSNNNGDSGNTGNGSGGNNGGSGSSTNPNGNLTSNGGQNSSNSPGVNSANANKSPATGDIFSIAWLCLAGIAVIFIFTFVIRRRKTY